MAWEINGDLQVSRAQSGGRGPWLVVLDATTFGEEVPLVKSVVVFGFTSNYMAGN